MLPQIKRKSLLYKSSVEYADFSLNHVEGCSHGCLYPCYAMMMKKRCGIVKNYQDWIKPKIVANALELLDKEIPRYKNKIKFVHLCFSTDPFMYNQPEITDLTLRIIARLNKDGIKCTILTKGLYPKELLEEKYAKYNEYGITLVSLSEDFKRKYEPFTAPFKKRIQHLKRLHDAGLRTWVSIEPYPTPNLVKQDLNKFLSEISFVNKIIFGRWNYSPHVSSYKNNKEFYENSAHVVEKFCKTRSIDYHIKFGTTARNDTQKKTAKKIFSNRTVSQDFSPNYL